MTHDDIEANLLAAEIRRKALAVQAFEKLAEHHRKVEAVKDITFVSHILIANFDKD